MKREITAFLLFLFFLLGLQLSAQDTKLNRKVRAYLESKEGTWRTMNVPASDGRLLRDLILKNRYTRGLEIGTSTGHSAIWMAWAFSMTGGKLITIELNESRYRQALKNIEEAGLSEFVDVRLANAHELVKELEGPFDFVFSDADKDWYINYFKAISPKLESGGCFTAHNIPTGLLRRGMPGTRAFLKYIQEREDYTTTVDSSGGGLSISYKK